MSSLVDYWSANFPQSQSTMLEQRVEDKFNNAVAGNIEVRACPSTKDSIYERQQIAGIEIASYIVQTAVKMSVEIVVTVDHLSSKYYHAWMSAGAKKMMRKKVRTR